MVNELRFKVGDRVRIADDCHRYSHQNKDRFGNVYSGIVKNTFANNIGAFHYIVKWDTGASTDEAYYRDDDLVPVERYTSNKIAAILLSKEW